MLEIVAMGLFIIAVLMIIWAFWLNVRNTATSRFRRSLVDFAFQAKPGWRERRDWFLQQPSYDEMCPSHPFGPFMTKPLHQMIGGEYEEEFWRWKNGD
jgi:hypothetical protein